MSDKNIDWSSAPEWADRLMHTPVNIDYWCAEYKFEEVTDVANCGSFGLTTGLMLSDMTLIEVRPIAIEDKEWLPVGRCEHIYSVASATTEWEEVNIIGTDKLGNYVFQNDKSTCYYSDPASEFRPLKTAEELERESFALSLSNRVYSLMSTYKGNPSNDAKSIASALLSDYEIKLKGEG